MEISFFKKRNFGKNANKWNENANANANTSSNCKFKQTNLTIKEIYRKLMRVYACVRISMEEPAENSCVAASVLFCSHRRKKCFWSNFSTSAQRSIINNSPSIGYALKLLCFRQLSIIIRVFVFVFLLYSCAHHSSSRSSFALDHFVWLHFTFFIIQLMTL